MSEQTLTPAARQQIQRVEQHIANHDDALAVPRVTAEFLHALVLAGGFRRGLEIGTSYGWSGLWIGSALQHNGGSLVTLDQSAKKVQFARDVFEHADLAATIETRQGVAAELIENVDGPLDFVFIDADKENCVRYFGLIWPKLAHRATLVTDNVTSHADQLADFVSHVRNHPQVRSMLVPIGSGLELSVRLEPLATTASVDGADWVI
jgi:predicted O-methyltransferase YrrM